MIVVVTTIVEPTSCILTLYAKIANAGTLLIIGDRKGPSSYSLPNTLFYSLEDQYRLGFKIVKYLPVDHYSRKNIGYLLAMQRGESRIYETDDDNEPNEYWQIREKDLKAVVLTNDSWVNVYNYFSSHMIWPRGFPLDKITYPGSVPVNAGTSQELTAPVQQGLVDRSPDVDAIWRLLDGRELFFERKESIALKEGSWSPFNTQSTWWWKEAFPLLYLPSYCSFRMTDIWKSFIAQRCLWEMGYKLVFHSAEVNQNRNVHNLMKDFEAELPGYILNTKIISLLENINLIPGQDNVIRNLIVCYECLIAHDIFPDKELQLVKLWALDVENLLY